MSDAPDWPWLDQEAKFTRVVNANQKVKVSCRVRLSDEYMRQNGIDRILTYARDSKYWTDYQFQTMRHAKGRVLVVCVHRETNPELVMTDDALKANDELVSALLPTHRTNYKRAKTGLKSATFLWRSIFVLPFLFLLLPLLMHASWAPVRNLLAVVAYYRVARFIMKRVKISFYESAKATCKWKKVLYARLDAKWLSADTTVDEWCVSNCATSEDQPADESAIGKLKIT